jgi:type I restriction enzyme, S subunit
MDLADNFQKRASDGLPRGWAETPLAQLLEALESGSRPKGGVRGIGEGVPSIGGEHLDEEGGFRFDAVKYVPFRFFDGMRRGRIQPGDVLVVKDGATTGKVALVRDDFPYNPAVVNEHVFVCRPSKLVHSPFLFYFLFSKEGQDRILSNFRGSAQGGINQSFAEGTNIRVAPLPEQMRIVARLEQLLPKVNAVRERLIRVKEIMKRFRQSALSAACSGRLTEDWRLVNPDLLPAQELLEKIKIARQNKLRNQIVKRDREAIRLFNKLNTHSFEKPTDTELPEGWCWSSLLNVCSLIIDCHNKTAPYVPRGIPLTRTTNIRDGRLIMEDLRYVSERTYEYWSRRCHPEPGDILFTREAPMGESAIIPNGTKLCMGQRMMLLRFFHDLSSVDFFAYAIRDPGFQYRLTLDSVGSGVKHLRVGDVESLVVPVPPFLEQKEIARRVDSLFKFADEIEKRVEAELLRTEKMTQAILAKAFRGELVASEKEL